MISHIASTRVPARVSLLGGGTDLPPFIKENGYGISISVNINLYIFTIAKIHTTFFDEKYRLSYSKTELRQEISDIENNIARGILSYLNWESPLYISTVSDIPENCGLSSSSAFSLGLLNSLYTLLDKPTDPYQIANDAFLVESKILGRRSGYQDHFSCAFGGFNIFEYCGHHQENAIVKRCVIPNQTKIQDSLNNTLMLIYLGKRTGKTYLDNSSIPSTAQDQIKDVFVKTSEVKENLFKGYSLENSGFYETINSLWKFKRNSLINDPVYSKILKIEQTLSNFDINCVRLCGAGGGGFLLVIAKPHVIIDLANALKKTFQIFCPSIDTTGITLTHSS